MRVRISFKAPVPVQPLSHDGPAVVSPALLGLSTVLAPGSLVAFSIGLWRMAVDLRWMRDSAVSTGLFSHWQMWVASALLLCLAVPALERLAIRHTRGGRSLN